MEENISISAQYLDWRNSVIEKGKHGSLNETDLQSIPGIKGELDTDIALDNIRQGFIPIASPYEFQSERSYFADDFAGRMDQKYGAGNWKAKESKRDYISPTTNRSPHITD